MGFARADGEHKRVGVASVGRACARFIGGRTADVRAPLRFGFGLGFGLWAERAGRPLGPRALSRD